MRTGASRVQRCAALFTRLPHAPPPRRPRLVPRESPADPYNPHSAPPRRPFLSTRYDTHPSALFRPHLGIPRVDVGAKRARLHGALTRPEEHVAWRRRTGAVEEDGIVSTESRTPGGTPGCDKVRSRRSSGTIVDIKGCAIGGAGKSGPPPSSTVLWWVMRNSTMGASSASVAICTSTKQSHKVPKTTR